MSEIRSSKVTEETVVTASESNFFQLGYRKTIHGIVSFEVDFVYNTTRLEFIYNQRMYRQRLNGILTGKGLAHQINRFVNTVIQA